MRKNILSVKIKQLMVVFMTAIIIGSVMTNITEMNNKNMASFANEYMAGISNDKMSFYKMLMYAQTKRLPYFVIIFLASLTPVKKQFSFIFSFVLGLFWSIVLCSLSMVYSGRAIWIFFIGIMLHTILYILSFCVMFMDMKADGKKECMVRYSVGTFLFYGGVLTESLTAVFFLPFLVAN